MYTLKSMIYTVNMEMFTMDQNFWEQILNGSNLFARLEEVIDNRDWGRGENLSRYFFLIWITFTKNRKTLINTHCNVVLFLTNTLLGTCVFVEFVHVF
jgi:hypothetical protein